MTRTHDCRAHWAVTGRKIATIVNASSSIGFCLDLAGAPPARICRLVSYRLRLAWRFRVRRRSVRSWLFPPTHMSILLHSLDLHVKVPKGCAQKKTVCHSLSNVSLPLCREYHTVSQCKYYTRCTFQLIFYQCSITIVTIF